jgi:hypothetical protein
MIKVTPAQFAQFLAGFGADLEKHGLAAAQANAELTGSKVREHITKDDLPLTALSLDWIQFKLSHGFKSNHLWYTGQYLANFGITRGTNSVTVGTNRPTKNSGFNLPELLEQHYPVWRLTLDELEPLLRANYLAAVKAAANNSKPSFKRQ